MPIHNQRPPLALHERLFGFCRHRVFALSLPIILAALILLAELVLPSRADYGAFLLIPLLLATYCGGWKYGVALGWLLAAAELFAGYQQLGATTPGSAIINFLIWGTVGTVLVTLTSSILETQKLRESYVQLRTLQQTMVTVNDIVRNRLTVLLAVYDVLDEGRMPSARQVKRGRAVIEEIVQLLDRLGWLQVVTVKEVAGVEAIDLDVESRTG